MEEGGGSDWGKRGSDWGKEAGGGEKAGQRSVGQCGKAAPLFLQQKNIVAFFLTFPHPYPIPLLPTLLPYPIPLLRLRARALIRQTFDALFVSTRDGGATWVAEPVIPNAVANAIDLVDMNNAYATTFLRVGGSSLMAYRG